MLKIVITGPESCGKTTLATQLATHFNAPLVSEFAREFLQNKDTPQYVQADLLKIAQQQCENENAALSIPNNTLIICDTDVLTLKIWSEEKYNSCDIWILNQLYDTFPTIYFLCSPENIAWEEDDLRENPHDRTRLFYLYEENLKNYDKTYFILRGTKNRRFHAATAEIINFHGHFI